MIKNNYLQRLVILLACINLSQAMENSESTTSQDESSTYEVCIRSSMTGELMETLHIQKEEIDSLQVTLAARYYNPNPEVEFRYIFNPPEVTKDKININYVKVAKNYRVETYTHIEDQRAMVMARVFLCVPGDNEVYIHSRVLAKEANSVRYYMGNELDDRGGFAGDLYVDQVIVGDDEVPIKYLNDLPETVNIASELSDRTGRSFFDSMKFLYLSNGYISGTGHYSITNPENGLYSLNSISENTIMVQLLIENQRVDRNWYRNYGQIFPYYDTELPRFPSGSRVVEIVVGAKSYKFKDELPANQDTFDAIHIALTSGRTNYTMHSRYQNLDLAEAMRDVREIRSNLRNH